MGSKDRKSPYETYRNGQWTLLGVTVITAINLLIAAFSFGLFFPLSAWIPRDLFLRAQGAGGTNPVFYFGSFLLFGCYALCVLFSYRSDRFPAMRAAFLLYAADTAYYFLLFALPGIMDDGFRTAYLIELLFRGFALYQFYHADGVFRDPGRKNPHVRSEAPSPKREEEKPEQNDGDDEDEEDEGIQWTSIIKQQEKSYA